VGGRFAPQNRRVIVAVAPVGVGAIAALDSEPRPSTYNTTPVAIAAPPTTKLVIASV